MRSFFIVSIMVFYISGCSSQPVMKAAVICPTEKICPTETVYEGHKIEVSQSLLSGDVSGVNAQCVGEIMYLFNSGDIVTPLYDKNGHVVPCL